MKNFIKIITVGLALLVMNLCAADAKIADRIRTSMKIRNNTGKNLNIIQKKIDKTFVRIGSVPKNETALLSNIQLEEKQPWEEIAKLEIVDAQENKAEYFITILREKEEASAESRSISVSAKSGELADSVAGSLQVDPSRGAATVLINVTINDKKSQDPIDIDVTAMQGSNLE